ncbi:MAG: vWA domain-containing protein [Planctomycetota bacterium]
MLQLQQFLAWYLGLKVPSPGEGTAWRLDWRVPGPEWLVAVGGVALLVLVAWVYRRDGEALRGRQRFVLIALRLAVFALVVAMLTELSLTVERTGLPSIAVMIDVSASMSLQDQYPPTSQAARMAKSLAQTPGRDGNRLALAQDVMTRNGGEFLRELERDHQVRLYRFAESASPLEVGDLDEAVMPAEAASKDDGAKNEADANGDTAAGSDGTGGLTSPAREDNQKGNLNEKREEKTGLTPKMKTNGSPFEAAIAEIKSLRAEGDQTRPAPAVKKVLGDLRGTPPAALILFTDGVASVSDADKLSTVAEAARRKGVQLHIVGLGSDEAAKDLQLFDTLVDEVAFVGDPMLFAAKVKGFGYAGRKVTLRLRKEGDSTALVTQEVTAPADGQALKVELSYTSPTAGEFDLVLQIVPPSDETNKENNFETRHVSVREEKIRVLLADGLPRYEFRYLKQLLERDKSIELSTLLQDADLEYAQEDRTAIQHFPVKREDLAKFDVLVLGDLSPTLLGPAVMENVRDFVREKGGSVVFIAGPQSNPVEFGGTPLEVLLPFAAADVRAVATEATSSDSFHPALTLEGQKGNSLFRLGDTEADSLRIWNGLPNLFWLVEIPKTKPGVRVFAEHPLKSGMNGRLPVIAIQQVGGGKVLFHATDETWRWRFRTGDLHYGRYWIQAIRYLSRGRLIGKDRTAELSVDQLVYQRGQPVTLRVRFVDEKFLPTDASGVTVILDRKGEGRQTVRLTRLRESPTMFEAQVARLAEGTYHAWVSQPAFNEAPPATDFRIEAPQRELQRRGMDKTDLQLAAKLSHGRFYTLDDVDRLPGEIPRGTPVPLQTDEPIPLWNRWEILSLLATLLTGEWLLRKRWRLV